MPLIRRTGSALGRLIGTTVKGGRLVSRGVRRGVGTARSKGARGETGMMRLFDLHAASCAGDTLITIGLAGTIFFDVPLGEARTKVALYLLVTMIPFALLAPVVGPLLDHFRHGRRWALAATFLAYGLVEVAGGYGFLAVFVAARAIRAAERSHEYHQVLHDFAEQVERLLTVLLLLLFGGAVVSGLLGPLTWPAALVAVALVFVVRPLAGWLSLRGAPGRPAEHWVIGIFGIRGIGSFYYLAYATSHADFPGEELVWATAGLAVVVSVVVHGIAATPVMALLDRSGQRTPDESVP